jgi:CBS domain-containing protein
MTPSGVLEVRLRATVHGDGRVEEDGTVYCPIRQGTMELEACRRCEDCEAIAIDPHTRRQVVACRGAQPSSLGPEGQEVCGAAFEERDDRHADEVRVSELMTPDVVCVGPDVAASHVGQLLVNSGISGVPVVDAEGHPLGLISKTDLLRELSLGLGPDGEPLATASGEAADLTAADLMTPVAFSLREHASLAQAAALMAFEGVHRLPIVSEANRVVGILSATDVMRWVAQSSGYIVRDVRASR